MMNILVTAIGSFSVAEVIRSLKQCTGTDNIIGCDIYPEEWHYTSRYFDKFYRSPYVADHNAYLSFLLNLIEKENINVIIPSTDPEVDFFNKNRHQFNHVTVIIGPQKFVEIARDKQKMQNFLERNKFPYIKSYLPGELKQAPYPIIAKPLNGRSSEGIEYLPDFSHLKQGKDYSNYLFQDFINGEIWTIDILRNHNTNEMELISRKELLRTKNGAGMTVEISNDIPLIDQAKSICEKIDAHGAFNMEFIRTPENDFLMDINPRFSAGIGFTNKTGYDLVKNALFIFLDKPIEKVKSYKKMILQKQLVDVINKTF